ncbi:hypothetical protein [Aliagarivorans taiwanensis]|uniref:hypothetical protein n=1 Tax=Aliagarivorans taiwanensis TaxID=561966 RepID=UPI00040EABBE|nr:hypothetical protein [Aliagarivorans taiwanensis]
MLNKYRKALEAYIAELQQYPLAGITNFEGKPASWDDWAWVYHRLDGVKLNFHFVDPNRVTHPRLGAQHRYCSDDLLPPISRHTVMAFVLDHLGERSDLGTSSFIGRQLCARHFFAYFGEKITTLTQQEVNDFVDSRVAKPYMVSFKPVLEWCRERKFIRTTILTPQISDVDRGQGHSVELALKRQKRKMPDERALRALAAIFNHVSPDISSLENIELYSPQRNAFIVCMTTLAMSAPNRMAAEQLTLVNQKLKSRIATRIEKGKEITQPIYWLDWRGSKGYKNNDNHILAAMSDPVNTAIEWLRFACEPARVLCRFYENPNRPLSALLGTYRSDKLAEYPQDKPVNLFQLGYILGFYDKGEGRIRLWPNAESVKHRSHEKYFKHVSKLCDSDILRFNGSSLEQLIGVSTSSAQTLYEIVGKHPNVATFQKNWIAHIKRSVPTFPNRIIGTQSVSLSNALFNFTGRQVSSCREKGGYKLANSYYAIETLKLNQLLQRKLSGTTNEQTIFEDFGFSSGIRINPHQFRHWLNTKAQESGLSDEVIALWSGRTSVQQNAVYDHTPDSDRIARIAELSSPQNKAPKEIRVVTKEEYQHATNKAASITATGICTQQLTVNPCTYLNDFVTQCALCSSSIHVNRDSKAIDILSKDLSVQKIRLKQARCSKRLRTSISLQNWFITHHKNTTLLEQLLELMNRQDIKKGSPIRFVSQNAVFRVTDIENRRVKEIKAILPDSRTELSRLLDSDAELEPSSENGELTALLSSFGLTQE